MIRDLMVQEARLALAAFAAGNLARYAMHQGNARQLADHLALQETQEQERRQRQSVYLAPGVISKSDDSDFLKKDNALFACIRWFAGGIAGWLVICGAAGFIARRLGWL